MFSVPYTYYVVERFAASRRQRATQDVPAGEIDTQTRQ
jgi:hypothetical protein